MAAVLPRRQGLHRPCRKRVSRPDPCPVTARPRLSHQATSLPPDSPGATKGHAPDGVPGWRADHRRTGGRRPNDPPDPRDRRGAGVRRRCGVPNCAGGRRGFGGSIPGVRSSSGSTPGSAKKAQRRNPTDAGLPGRRALFLRQTGALMAENGAEETGGVRDYSRYGSLQPEQPP